MDNFLGEIKIFGGDFPPYNWAFCAGQILPSQGTYSELYKILGNRFGGDPARGTFALPDLRGRVAGGAGQGPGLTNRELGKTYGAETIKLEVQNLPQHSHPVNVVKANGTLTTPTGSYISSRGRDDKDFTKTNQPNVVMNSGTIGVSGGDKPVSNMQPYINLNYIIALSGVKPDR